MRKNSRRTAGWFAAALILTMAMPFSGVAQEMSDPGLIQTPAAPMDIEYVDPRPLDKVVATSDQGELTIEQIMQYCFYNHLMALSGLNLGMVNQLPDDMLTGVATHIVSRQAAFDTLYAEGSAEDIKKAEEAFEASKSRLLIGMVVKNEVTDKLTSPTAEAIQSYYDTHKFEFEQPFSFKMRHLVLLTYEPYVVKAGDTLESIARDVCGDTAQAGNIRSDEAQRPLRKTESENQPPLYEGEKLLVPMPENRAQAVRERLEGILRQMDEGKSFEALAEQHSEGLMRGDVIGPLPSGTKEMLPDLIEIARETPLGEVSRIFRTKHGFQAIQIVEKQEERLKTLDEVSGDIVSAIKNKEQLQLFDELVAKLYGNPDLEVYYDRIAQGDTLKPDDVIARLGEKEFVWADAKKLWETNGRPNNEKLIDENVIRAIQPLQIALINEMAKPITDDPENVISRELAIIKPEKVGQAYIELLARREAEKQVDEAAVEAFYEANKDQYFKAPPTVKFDSMVMIVTPDKAMGLSGEEMDAEIEKMKGEMATKLEGVESAGDFLALAENVNAAIKEYGTNPPGTAGDFIPLDKLEKNIAEAIEGLEPGQWSKPFKFAERSVMSVLLEDMRPASHRPLDDVRDEARFRAQRIVALDHMKELEAEFARKANLEIKL